MQNTRASESPRLPPLARAQLVKLGVDPDCAVVFEAYLAELVKWNAAYNLTAVRDPAAMVTRHLLDSLAVLPHVAADPARELRLLDVGSGAGLPGLVLAIARPGWRVSVLDSNGKKARFLRHAVRTLGLANVEVVEARVEVWQSEVLFDCILSRAFAGLGEFVAASAHLLAADGRFLAMKGKVAAEELASLPAGMSIAAIHTLEVAGLNEARELLVVRRA